MTLTDLKQEIEKTEELIFRNSLYKNITLNELAESYKNLMYLRNEFLLYPFSDVSLDELEEIRYKINECMLNVRISIREMVGLSCEREVEEMMGLWSE